VAARIQIGTKAAFRLVRLFNRDMDRITPFLDLSRDMIYIVVFADQALVGTAANRHFLQGKNSGQPLRGLVMNVRA
jgi:hypothetical protein